MTNEILLDHVLKQLQANWDEVAGEKLAPFTFPVQFREDGQQLIVSYEDEKLPPWGRWDEITKNRDYYIEFFQRINQTISNHRIQYISFYKASVVVYQKPPENFSKFCYLIVRKNCGVDWEELREIEYGEWEYLTFVLAMHKMEEDSSKACELLHHLLGVQSYYLTNETPPKEYERLYEKTLKPLSDGEGLDGFLTKFTEALKKLHKKHAGHFYMKEPILEQYRNLSYDSKAKQRISVAPYPQEYWSDEHPPGGLAHLYDVDGLSYASANALIIVRKHIWATDEVPYAYEMFWEEAKQTIPDWPGFRRM